MEQEKLVAEPTPVFFLCTGLLTETILLYCKYTNFDTRKQLQFVQFFWLFHMDFYMISICFMCILVYLFLNI